LTGLFIFFDCILVQSVLEQHMIAAIIRGRTLLCVPFLLLAGVTSSWAQVPVTTWHYDNSRTGVNPKETILTPQNVNFEKFGKLFTHSVDGAIIGQALYLPDIRIPGKGTHNVVYVATMHDSVYGFDADSHAGSNANPLWHTTFLIGDATTVPITLQGCEPTTKWTKVGIVSTPVIDPVASTLFVVAKTYEHYQFVHRLHALNVATGLERAGSPVVITASYEFAGVNNIFKDAMQVNRPALLLENGQFTLRSVRTAAVAAVSRDGYSLTRPRRCNGKALSMMNPQTRRRRSGSAVEGFLPTVWEIFTEQPPTEISSLAATSVSPWIKLSQVGNSLIWRTGLLLSTRAISRRTTWILANPYLCCRTRQDHTRI
jgi:hypothetical protein